MLITPLKSDLQSTQRSGRDALAWRRQALLLTFACLSLQALPANAVWQWLRGAALTDFNESDWMLIKETAATVLNDKPDREQVNWSNPETGNKGSIIALVTFTHEGRKCRRTAMRNITFRGREDRAAYSLCQQADGDWIFVAESALLDATPE